jgi:hypothetical protein
MIRHRGSAVQFPDRAGRVDGPASWRKAGIWLDAKGEQRVEVGGAGAGGGEAHKGGAGEEGGGVCEGEYCGVWQQVGAGGGGEVEGTG